MRRNWCIQRAQEVGHRYFTIFPNLCKHDTLTAEFFFKDMRLEFTMRKLPRNKTMSTVVDVNAFEKVRNRLFLHHGICRLLTFRKSYGITTEGNAAAHPEFSPNSKIDYFFYKTSYRHTHTHTHTHTYIYCCCCFVLFLFVCFLLVFVFVFFFSFFSGTSTQNFFSPPERDWCFL